MHVQALTLLIGFITGIVCATFSRYGSEIAVLAFILGILQMSLSVYERKIQKEKEEARVSSFSFPVLSSLFCIMLVLGILRVQFSYEKNNFVCSAPCTVTGVLTDTPELKEAYQLLVVRLVATDTRDVLVKVPLYPRYSIGDRITFSGNISPPKLYQQHDDKKIFNYGAYLAIKGIGSEVLYPKIISVEKSQEKSVSIFLGSIKENLIGEIHTYMSEPDASLASGMLFGDKNMSQELKETFRVSGLSHIVVLSGFNISILISVILFVLTFLPLALRILSAAFFVCLFVVMVGGEASIVRATLMAFVSLTALLLGKQYTGRQALIISFFAIIAYSPESLFYDVSLHLSCIATAGIIYLSEGLRVLFQKCKPKAFQEILVTTLAAYGATLPYIMYTFGTVSLYALLANIIALPFVPVSMFLTFCVVLTSKMLPLLASAAGYLAHLPTSLIIGISRLIETLPFSSVSFQISGGEMVLFYLVLAFCFLVLTHTKKNETLLTENDEIVSGIISY